MEIELCGYKVLIDDVDYDKVKTHKWFVNHSSRDLRNKVYFIANRRDETGKIRTIQLHRVLMNLETGSGGIVDHANGNTLDNRRCNLRVCTIQENTRNQKRGKKNTSGYKGVSWNKERQKWYATIKTSDKCLFLGRYDDIKDAYNAYCEASKKYHGEFGRTE